MKSNLFLSKVGCILLFCFIAITGKAADMQRKNISGTVYASDDNEPLMGVSVAVKGTGNGTVTDLDGDFNLDVAENDMLIFSYIGYESQEISVKNQQVIIVKLNPNTELLDEIVVIGYGTMKKSDLTGSVSTISSDAIKEQTVLSVDQALQGRAAGVVVTQASSSPGAGVTIKIRGGSSLSGGNEPLYIIDGVPVYNNNDEMNPSGGQGGGMRAAQNAMNGINPNDIESIEILKDASATAIYGSRGANGVVLITTKKGIKGSPKVELDMQYGFQSLMKKYDVLGASDFMQWVNECLTNQGNPEPFTLTEIASPLYDSDWQNMILRNDAVPLSNYQLNISGGNENVRYSLGGGYYDQKGIIKKTGFERYSFKINLDSDIKPWLTIGTNLSVSRTINNQTFEGGSGNNNSSVFYAALSYIPILPDIIPETGLYSRREDGNRPGYSPYGRPNPIQILNNTEDKTVGDRGLGSFYADIKPAKNLVFKFMLGGDYENKERDYYYKQDKSPNTADKGSATIGTVRSLNLINTNQVNYNKTVGKDHRFNFTGVFEWQKRVLERRSMSNSDFDNDVTLWHDIGAGKISGGPSVSSYREENSMISWLGRINYVWKDKYLFTMTGRADGSSKFGANNKWSFFPSAAIAWRISEEDFIKRLDVFSNLKLRGSVGQTGNQEIGSYNSLSTISRVGTSFGSQEVNGFTVTDIGNPDLKWETTTQYDLGVDLGFFRDRLWLNVDAYYKKTKDMLMWYSLPTESGFSGTTGNVGSMENKGLEITIGAQILNGKLKWRTDLNWAKNKNKVLDLGENTYLRGSRISYDYGSAFESGNWVFPGQPVGVFYGLIWDGIYNTESELNADAGLMYGTVTPQLGDVRYKDISGYRQPGENVTEKDNVIDSSDRTIIGDPNPDFVFGWTNTFSYRNFELSMFFQGSYGNDILNMNKRDMYSDGQGQNVSSDRYRNAWREGNEINALYPKPNAQLGMISWNAAGYSNFWIEDGSYLRLKNLRLAYHVPVKKWIKDIAALTVSFSAQNLFTITGYSGLNPEVSTHGQNSINQGIDFGSYPSVRTYMFGLNLIF